jgi:hypothetical protein
MGGTHQRLNGIKHIELESCVKVHKMREQICLTKLDYYPIINNKNILSLAQFDQDVHLLQQWQQEC